MSETDKMLARREGGVGHLIFNNPERRNAVSLDMWAAATKILEDFARDGRTEALNSFYGHTVVRDPKKTSDNKDEEKPKETPTPTPKSNEP